MPSITQTPARTHPAPRRMIAAYVGPVSGLRAALARALTPAHTR